ncbi:trimeric LpxA-like protein [Aspergillus pseudodeflectus]|uniref:Dynactin subunit 5 n=2 Tax=Aspergillus subgen. Nidulantes TaxID=2720870 RepID=A0A0U5CDJ3_ASPCI|nr:Putative Dynactin Arp1 p25 subunit [Aspergillus calidoustus]
MPPKAAKGEYIETDTGNKISRRSQIHGTQHIILGGKSIIQADAVIRGDLFRTSSSASTPDSKSDPKAAAGAAGNQIAITIGRYSYISRSAILRPPSRLHRGIHSYFPLKIGDHVFVGERSVVEAASVGNHVHIGKDAVIGSMAILKEFAYVLDGAVVPAGMVVPSWCVVGGAPARIVGEVGEGYGVEGAEGGMARERYRMVR